MIDEKRDCSHGQLARSCHICELEAENVELKEALSGRTVSCSNCNRLEAVNAQLVKENAEIETTMLNAIADLQKALVTRHKFEAVAKAAESLKWVCDQLGYGRQRTLRDDAIKALDKALAALKKET